MITPEEFFRADIRVGTILLAEEFPEARNPAYKLTIDFGPETGIMKSSAQITHLYSSEQLIGMQITAVVNFPPRQIGPFLSQCLVLGAIREDGSVSLLETTHPVKNGTRIS